MMAVEAAKKLVMSASPTDVDCDVRSDSVRAISVTLRSTATADENSTVPKNITSISGTITANSVAASALPSARKSYAERRVARQKFAIACIVPPRSMSLVRLVPERGRGHEQPLVAREIGDVVAEPG